MIGLKDRMKHDKLVEWIKSPQIPVSRRRLVSDDAGRVRQAEDLPLLEELIQSKDRQTKGALDALVAAYLTLKGPDGMPLVEDLFLKNKDAEYTDTYATIMALRFHGTEEKIIPRERLLDGIRMMLDRPQLADLVIPDLARWEDWSVMDRLVELFKNADDESNWVRVPVINYLRACPLPKAKERIDELAKLDPETVKRASTLFFPLGAGTPPTAATTDKPAEGTTTPAAAAEAKSAADAKPAANAKTPADGAGRFEQAGRSSANGKETGGRGWRGPDAGGFALRGLLENRARDGRRRYHGSPVERRECPAAGRRPQPGRVRRTGGGRGAVGLRFLDHSQRWTARSRLKTAAHAAAMSIELEIRQSDADYYEQYRALSTSAVASLIVGLLSCLAVLDWMLVAIAGDRRVPLRSMPGASPAA